MYYPIEDFSVSYDEIKEDIYVSAKNRKNDSPEEIHRIIREFAEDNNFTLTAERESELYDLCMASKFDEEIDNRFEEKEIDNSIEEDKYLDMVDPEYLSGY